MAGSVAAGFLAVALGVAFAQCVAISREERTAATTPEASVNLEANGLAGDAEAALKTKRAT
jgi:hypothetical protein